MATNRPVDTTNAATARDGRNNPLVALVALGKSIWLDRDTVEHGEERKC